jgi:hypothetical protein
LVRKESELKMEEQARIDLVLTVAEVNVILRSLGKHPFEEIAVLIQKIKAQGEAQLAEMQAAAAPAEAPAAE